MHNAGWLESAIGSPLPLHQQQNASGNGQHREQVAAVGEVDVEGRCRQKAVQDEPDGQQEHPEILGDLHRTGPPWFGWPPSHYFAGLAPVISWTRRANSSPWRLMPR